jgi:hypothetical protein
MAMRTQGTKIELSASRPSRVTHSREIAQVNIGGSRSHSLIGANGTGVRLAPCVTFKDLANPESINIILAAADVRLPPLE